MRLVVDASVARAAGRGTPGSSPPAPESVAALEAARASGTLTVAMSPALKQEWDKHAAPFAFAWLRHMVATKRFSSEANEWPGLPNLVSHAASLPGSQVEEVHKDLHLVSLAMLTDQRVLSLDDRQRTLLTGLADKTPPLAALHWASPRNPLTVPWLTAGAPPAPHLQLQVS